MHHPFVNVIYVLTPLQAKPFYYAVGLSARPGSLNEKWMSFAVGSEDFGAFEFQSVEMF